MYFVGLDIHKEFTFGVVKDETGNVVNKAKFENNEENFESFFKGFLPDETKVVMESTGVWEYVYEIISSKGYAVKLANPSRTKAIASAKIKTDAIDAATLADLLRANLVAESYIPSKEMRVLRDVMRQRKTLVKGKTQIKNKIHAVLIRHGIKLPYKTLCSKAIDWLKGLNVSDILVSYYNLLEQYNTELNFIEEHIKKIAEEDKQAQLVMTAPGMGPIRAMEVLAEIADIKRFSTNQLLCSYAGLVPSIKQSGNTLRHGTLIKQANTTLKNAMIEAAWSAVRTKEANTLKLYYLKLKDKKGKQKAICATARKLLCIIHAMLKKNEPFRA